MPGFETIVRPVVFPNIRPVPTRSLPPGDPEQGKCTIGGGGGGIIADTENISVNGSLHIAKETERRVDTARVYQKQDDGTINRENFVDIEVANRITMEVDVSGSGGGTPGVGSGTPGVGNEKALGGGGGKGTETEKYSYEPVEEKDNVEVKKRDTIKKPSGLRQAR